MEYKSWAIRLFQLPLAQWGSSYLWMGDVGTEVVRKSQESGAGTPEISEPEAFILFPLIYWRIAGFRTRVRKLWLRRRIGRSHRPTQRTTWRIKRYSIAETMKLTFWIKLPHAIAGRAEKLLTIIPSTWLTELGFSVLVKIRMKSRNHINDDTFDAAMREALKKMVESNFEHQRLGHQRQMSR